MTLNWRSIRPLIAISAKWPISRPHSNERGRQLRRPLCSTSGRTSWLFQEAGSPNGCPMSGSCYSGRKGTGLHLLSRRVGSGSGQSRDRRESAGGGVLGCICRGEVRSSAALSAGSFR